MSRVADAGFTLIETLVALAVLATSGVALLGATEAHIARIGALETRAAAQWVAENYMAELKLGLTPNDRPDPMLGMDFVISAQRSGTEDTDLERVDLTVTSAADSIAYAVLTGFVDLVGSAGRQP